MSKSFSITINNKVWSQREIEKDQIVSDTENEAEVLAFLQLWFQGAETFYLNTSGSTGRPKTIGIKRSQFIASAKATGSALGIIPKTSTLCCLPVRYVAGKMQIVRALVLDLELTIIEPSSTPSISGFEFTSMTPMQFYQVYQKDTDSLNTYNCILIGGGELSKDIEVLASNIKAKVYHTYGMTETVSHIALRRINHEPQSHFHCLPNVEISVDEKGCLKVVGEVTNNKVLQTNDIVELISGNEFRWLGRADHVINTGGIKIHPEQLEIEYRNILSTMGINNRFYIVGAPDNILGQKICLVIETQDEYDLTSIKRNIQSKVVKYQVPKEVIFTPTFSETESGKVLRKLPTSI